MATVFGLPSSLSNEGRGTRWTVTFDWAAVHGAHRDPEVPGQISRTIMTDGAWRAAMKDYYFALDYPGWFTALTSDIPAASRKEASAKSKRLSKK
jgi:hypothetical protein